MKAKPILSFFAVATLFFAVPSGEAAISITNFSLTENGINFNISGTFPSPLPPDKWGLLLFVNPNPTATPGFALGSVANASSSAFSGPQPLDSPIAVATGISSIGDYFFVAFQNDFAIGEAISGNLAAAWSSNVFVPTRVNSLNVYWGDDLSLYPNPPVLTSGTFLTTVAVPEPSTTTFLFLGAVAALTILRRLRKPNKIR